VSKSNLVPQATPPIPADILSLFGTPPLLSTEDPKNYWDFFSRLAKVIKPKNVIEWVLMKDIVSTSCGKSEGCAASKLSSLN
jgi:hypothetical protein